MGKKLFTPSQKIIFDKVTASEFFRKNFYFTGGTALSVFYLNHRYSEDLDFFCMEKFDRSLVLEKVRLMGAELGFTFTHQWKEVVYVFFLKFPREKPLKVDFGYYPHVRVEKGKMYQGMQIDSLLDIAINKLSTINQRLHPKDFVDLYYLLKKFTIWDLIEGVKVKFRMEVEPWILASDLEFTVDKLKFMPEMIKPLKLEEMKKYFRKLSLTLAKKTLK